MKWKCLILRSAYLVDSYELWSEKNFTLNPHLNLWIIPSCFWSQWQTQHKVLVLQRVLAASDVLIWSLSVDVLYVRNNWGEQSPQFLIKVSCLRFWGWCVGWRESRAGRPLATHTVKRRRFNSMNKISKSKLQKRENKLRERERERERETDRQTDRQKDLLLRNKSYPRYITQTSHIILHCVCFCINDTTDKQVCSLLYVYILPSSNYLNYWMKYSVSFQLIDGRGVDKDCSWIQPIQIC